MIPQILRMRRLTQNSLNSKPADQEDRTSFKVAADSRRNRLESTEGFSSDPLRSNQATSTRSAEQRREIPVRSTASDQQYHSGKLPDQEVISTSYEDGTRHSNPTPDLTTPPSPTAAQILEQETQDNSQEYLDALDQFIAIAEQRVASLRTGDSDQEKQQYIAAHAYLRMLYLMANRPERALEAIPETVPADQEFWQQMFWAMSNYFDTNGIPNASDRATHTISQLSEAIERLRQQANLELRTVSFCTKIDGFGTYNRFERAEFRPGQPVLIYAEVRNFLSRPTSDGQYKTVLKSTIEVHRGGKQGGFISKQEFSPTEDLCRNRRNDYFHSYLLNIPKDLPTGPYVLKLIVEDQLNHKVASYMVNFTIN